MHRISLKEGSTLKLREYCAIGLPFIYAYNDDDFDDNFIYAAKIPADDSPVNIYDVIDFYKRLEGTDYSIKMNDFARKNLSWEAKLKPVFEYLDKIRT